MLTVMVGFEGSGKRRMRSPFGRRYSEMPSTSATLTGVELTVRPAVGGGRRSGLPVGVTVPVLGGAGGAARGAVAGAALGVAAGVDSGGGAGAFCASGAGVGACAGAGFFGSAGCGGCAGVCAAASVTDRARQSATRVRVMGNRKSEKVQRGRRIISEGRRPECHSALQGVGCDAPFATMTHDVIRTDLVGRGKFRNDVTRHTP